MSSGFELSVDTSQSNLREKKKVHERATSDSFWLVKKRKKKTQIQLNLSWHNRCDVIMVIAIFIQNQNKQNSIIGLLEL